MRRELPAIRTVLPVDYDPDPYFKKEGAFGCYRPQGLRICTECGWMPRNQGEVGAAALLDHLRRRHPELRQFSLQRVTRSLAANRKRYKRQGAVMMGREPL